MKIIAEIGTAHQGDLKQAETLIKAAARSGADCAKFQIVYAREILHPETGLVELPGGSTPLYKVFEALERDASFYQDLKDLTEGEGLEFLATPFGLESAGLLHSLNPEEVKIASPEVNHIPLLEEIATWKLPVLLSSGVSRLSDLELALDILGRDKTTLLHCVTSYPAPEEEYNLAVLPHLAAILGVATGVSDHSMDPELVPGLAFIQGAQVLEKHFTLSRGDGGLDDPIALDAANFRRMCDYIAMLEPLTDSFSRMEKMEKDFSKEKIRAVLGSGQKLLAPCEAENYGRTNRSIHALGDLAPGTVLTEENMAVLRTEKVLGPGVSPVFYKKLIGKITKRYIPAGEGILLEDLMEEGD
ncbi:MAG: spore coat protein [Spirochaetaceae bacterium 4572_59]|nr:MAG: spore coat protein [Spirochaetaceae bacterium 4572_59]